MDKPDKATFKRIAENSFDALEENLKLLHKLDIDEQTISQLKDNVVERLMIFIDHCYGKNMQMMSMMEVKEFITSCYAMLIVGYNVSTIKEQSK